MLFVISGPSGCGKSTLVKHVLSVLSQVAFSVSHTTRPQREGEEEGTDYNFVDRDKFDSMITESRLAEWAVVHGNYYGTSKRELEHRASGGTDVILDIDVQGARQIREKYKKGLFIFVLPPSFAQLKQRLVKRGQDDPDVISQRLAMARKEIRAYPQFDYIIINDALETAQQELEAIIISERCRLHRRQKDIIPILRSFTEPE
ncbi:MAG: guanylate kinase [Candidatus Aminicenantaceae bacterium]